ncbi:MAG: metal ABC transporter ATP-binding protein [Thaumarchaeota archaeon]|nr:metal ABC transporter ATP-binding protein [Nitrososphaerota archaeon]GFN40377.1 MAG: zinc uptake system ATP-binding protein ZurA [Marine Group I thaumarchaeote]
MKLVDIKNLTVDFDRILALQDVNFSVSKGDFLGIIGPNGAGKTTLFSCMLGLTQNFKGEIKFFDKNIRKSKQYLTKVGYVPQKPVFEKNFPATVKEVVKMGLRKHSDKDDKVDRTLQQVWIHELGLRRIGELSGGQLQRVFIAKALVNDPQILILDEPVTGIDSQSKELFYEILRGLNKNENLTIIWSSHDLEAVAKLANKVACLNRTLFFHGISNEFFSNEALLKQYSESSMQMHMHQH